MLVDLRRLEVARDLKAEQLKQLSAETQHVGLELGTIGNQIDALESQDSEARPVLESRMVELYKLGSAGYVRLLLNVADLKEFGRAYRMVAELAALDRARVADHQRNLEQLQVARAAAEQRRLEMASLQKSADAARAAAEQAAAERASLIADIDTRRDLTAQLASELQSAQQRLQQTLGAIGSGAPRAESDAAALPIRPFRGDLDWPVAGRLMTRFAGQAGRVSAAGMQNGIQIAADEGTSVRAVHDGTVAFAGGNTDVVGTFNPTATTITAGVTAFYASATTHTLTQSAGTLTGPGTVTVTGVGNLVIVDHGSNTFTLYGQLGAMNVAQGVKVDRGEPLGTAGRMLVGIPGVYFEIRVDGKPVDPLEWLKKRP